MVVAGELDPDRVFAQCAGCGARGPFVTVSEDIAAAAAIWEWNHRMEKDKPDPKPGHREEREKDPEEFDRKWGVEPGGPPPEPVDPDTPPARKQ